MAEMTADVPQPAFMLLYDQKDITRDITLYATCVSFTDKLSGEADEIDIELEDSAGKWRDSWYPGKGDTLTLSLGYKDKPLTPCGSFSIDEIELSAPPDTVAIRGRAASVTKAMRTKSNRGFEDTTLAAIAGRIAKKHSLKLEGQIAPLTLQRITQYGESDLAFLTRLAKSYGYIVKVSHNKLIFSHLKKLRAAAVIKTITREQLTGYSLRDTLNQTYSKVKNKHQHSQKRQLISFNADGTTSTTTVSGMSSAADTLNINESAATADEAQAKGEAALDQKNEYQYTGNLQLAGDPSLRAGASITLQGFGQASGTWLIQRARHEISRSSGFTTDLDIARGLKGGSAKKAASEKTLTVFKADGSTEQVAAHKGDK